MSTNRNGHSLKSSEFHETTKKEAEVPEQVINMRAWAISHEAIKVTWSPPAVTHGPLRAYRVIYNSAHQLIELYSQTNLTHMTLEDLHPYTNYYIRVVAYNINGEGTPTEDKTVRTFSAKAKAPRNLTIEVGGATTLAVRWVPPAAEDLNGEVTGYKIRVKRKDREGRAIIHTTDADARSYEVTGLDAAVTYLVRLAVININGTGELTPWQEATTYAVELDESRPPGEPSYITLKAFAREMIVSWGSTEDSEEVRVRGFKIGYGIGIPEQHWIEGISSSTRIYTLQNLTPKKSYVVQVMAYNNAGNGPNVQQQEVTSESAQPISDLMPPLQVSARALSSTSMFVTWYDDTLGEKQERFDDRVYTVKYNALSGSAQRKTNFLNTTDLYLRVKFLRPYTKYEFSVMITKGDRVSIYSFATRNTTLEDRPETAPRDLTVTLNDKRENMLMISWQPPVEPNGRIIRYTIYSNTNYQQPLDSWIVEEVRGDKLNHEFGPVTHSTMYFFRIAAHNSKGSSPPSEAFFLKTPQDMPKPGLPDEPGQVSPGQAGQNGGLNAGGSQTPQPNSGIPSAQTLWIIIACVSAITAVAIAALVVVLCRRRLLHDKKKPANLKATNQAPKGMNRSNKQQGPNLWIDHEQVELKTMDKEMDAQDIVDERTAMLRSSGSAFDVTSASMAGDGYTQIDEPRYCTLGRQRPVVIGPYQHRDTMPRAAVQPMSSDNSRPLYPRTQFATHHPGNGPRVNLGDLAQPPTDSFSQSTPTPYYNKPYMINGEEVPPPRPPPMEGRPYPLRSFNNSNGTGHNIPKHIVKPQPMSAFKPAAPVPSEPVSITDTDSLKRPPRPPYANRQLSQNSLGKEHLKMSLVRDKSGSTEQLNTDMANLDNLMQDLNSMKTDFQCIT